jgi:hypothetical protein
MKLKRGEKVNADVMKDISEDIYGVQVSTRTIRRVLNDHKLLKCCWQTRKSFNNQRNRQKRIQWAKDHLNWTKEQWASVLWSDESPFVYRYNKRQRVWCLDDPNFIHSQLQGTVKHD